MIENLIKLLGFNIIANLILIIGLPLFSNLYTPQVYGSFAVLASVISVVSPIICLRYDLAIPLGRTERGLKTLFYLSLLSCIMLSLIALVIFFVLDYFFPIYDENIYSATDIIFVFLIILLNGFLSSYSFLKVGEGNFTSIGASKFFGSSFLVSLQVILSKIGLLGLLMAQLFSAAVQILILHYDKIFRKEKISYSNEKISFSAIKSTASEYIEYPKISTPAQLMNLLCSFLPLWYITSVFGLEWAGLYAITSKLILGPFDILNKTLYDILYGRLCKIIDSNERSRVSFLVLKFIRRMVLPIFLTILIFVFPLYRVLFNEEWLDGEIFLAIHLAVACSGLMVLPLSGPLIQIFRVQSMSFKFQTILFILRFLGLYCGYLIDSNILYPLFGYALGTLVSHMYLSFWVYRKSASKNELIRNFLEYSLLLSVIFFITWFWTSSGYETYNNVFSILIFIFIAMYLIRIKDEIIFTYNQLKLL